MGIFPYKTKDGFGVLLETWTPKRRTKKLEPRNYPTYHLSEKMTLEQAKAVAQKHNKEERAKKRKSIQRTLEIQEKTYLNEKSLPSFLVEDFEAELKGEYKGNQDRLKTILQHWRTAKKMLHALKLDYTEFYDKRFDIFDYYEKQQSSLNKKNKTTYTKIPWSADYIKRITKILNKWGSFCARRSGTFFEPIPKIGIRYNQIAEEREKGSFPIKTAAHPLKWDDLKNAKSHFEFAKLLSQWNWMFIGLFFGLRPSEIQNLKKPTSSNKGKGFYRIEFDPHHKINVLYIYQNKLRNLSESKRWKVIPVYEPEQIEALEIIKSGNFDKPLNKTLRRFFEPGIETYSPRKGTTDLLLSRQYQLEDISVFLGHQGIETTWRFYKNKLSFQLPKRDKHLKVASGEN